MDNACITGPDLAVAEPLAQQLHQLDLLRTDEVGYAQVWVDFVQTAGDVLLVVDRDGTEALQIGQACDDQEHERRTRLAALVDHLATAGHRPAVTRLLLSRRRLWDDRPNDAQETTSILRAFIAHGGRLMIDPQGELVDAIVKPAVMVAGSEAQRRRCHDAHVAFLRLRRRHRSSAQIERTVRLAGRRTDHGWYVLEGKSA